MSSEPSLFYTDRSIKPRKRAKPCHRPILAVDQFGKVYGEHATHTNFDEYVRWLPFMPPHLVICFSPEMLLLQLHEHFKGNKRWTWRVATTDSHGRALLRKRVMYYGFKGERKRNSLHVILDANSFFRKQDDVTITDLVTLAQTVRKFCNDIGLEIKATAAGLASQLLRNPRFYPHARRRVPGFINDAARPHLPGGFYESYADTGQRIETALYIDQESAHHYAAQTTPLPDANSVRAIGYTRNPYPYARKGGILYDREIRKHGLLKAHVTVPTLTRDTLRFAPRFMHSPGSGTAYIWTNELHLLESFGLDVHYLIGLWGTQDVDKGLPEFARWAQKVTKQSPALKALLLMVYGFLAKRDSESHFYHPNGNETVILANNRVDGVKQSRPVKSYPRTTNVLQLGLIQSFVRALSLDMARQLHAGNHEVLSVYADGIFIKAKEGESVPLFSPWRIKEGCTLELSESMRVPVRARVRREYHAMTQHTQESHD